MRVLSDIEVEQVVGGWLPGQDDGLGEGSPFIDGQTTLGFVFADYWGTSISDFEDVLGNDSWWEDFGKKKKRKKDNPNEQIDVTDLCSLLKGTAKYACMAGLWVVTNLPATDNSGAWDCAKVGDCSGVG